MTDAARVRDPASILARLPRGTGVVFRDYDLDEREHVARDLLRVARTRGLVFLVGADENLALLIGADGVHWPRWRQKRESARREARPARWLETAAVHTPQEMARANRMDLDAVFVSPVFVTASHPGAGGLGLWRALALARRSRAPVIMLGGINGRTALRLPPGCASGLAAIGALTGE